LLLPNYFFAIRNVLSNTYKPVTLADAAVP